MRRYYKDPRQKENKHQHHVWKPLKKLLYEWEIEEKTTSSSFSSDGPSFFCPSVSQGVEKRLRSLGICLSVERTFETRIVVISDGIFVTNHVELGEDGKRIRIRRRYIFHCKAKT